ncbi:hypothetical protein Aple_103770 [Acrocarpospora pleiomorpha]|uniref:Gfo/Idh/MocA-like oxidoreductase N-terminal domain-containing protein n=2 Tax=Acrocarpospora pleiomorpha TaxID=90975 RepID=A0A5M3Y2D7_9ACTN|nr:hypothetical protein Aple_103770 [Acrocarpospora pleiomorpha]
MIGLAVIGCGTVGRIRAVLAREYPGVTWLGLCDIDAPTLKELADDTRADFATTDAAELLDRPEVTAVIVATDESRVVDDSLAPPAEADDCCPDHLRSQSRGRAVRGGQRRDFSGFDCRIPSFPRGVTSSGTGLAAISR